MTHAASPLIACFDVASATGCCHGRVSDRTPLMWTWILSDGGPSRPDRLAHLHRYCSAYFSEHKPDIVAYELPMPIGVIGAMMAKGSFQGAREETALMLRGAIGVLEACAAVAGIREIHGVEVQDARKHFCGRRTFPKGTAKQEVMKVCKSLGYRAETEHEADAVAIWSLMCATMNPRAAQATIGNRQLAALRSGPLFRFGEKS